MPHGDAKTDSVASHLTDSIGPVTRSRFGTLRPLDQGRVAIARAGLLGAWQSRNSEQTIPHCIDQMEKSGVLHNFRRVADGEPGPFAGMWFADSDLYKTLEAIGWESGRQGTAVEQRFVDMAVDLIERTQAPDGYLNTYVQGQPGKSRWDDLVTSHELYCAGHLFQAAVALSRGAGDDRLLAVALRLAQRILDDLGARDDGYDGHPEVETALVELYRTTGDDRWLGLARTEIDRRGRGHMRPDGPFGRDYFVDREPLVQMSEAVGHAVRQLYLATGATDIYLEDGTADLLAAVERIWQSAYGEKTYLTGGQGSRHAGEEFGDPYELPADRAYSETCAGIASLQWNWRLLLATGQARYAAAMETVLYNTIAAAVSVDGRHFFYTNPLQMRTGHRGSTENAPAQRTEWFECACCPPNLARLMASLQHYLATTSDAGVQIHQLTPLDMATRVGERPVEITVETEYPWVGSAMLTVTGESVFELALRVPSGARNAVVTVDGEVWNAESSDGYLRIRTDWSGTHRVGLHFDLSAHFVSPHPRIDAVRGTMAVRRGPLVYCIEGADQAPGAVLEDLRVDPTAPIETIHSPLAGVEVALRLNGYRVESPAALYTDDVQPTAPVSNTDLVAIPYFAWGNRGVNAMRVWIPTERP